MNKYIEDINKVLKKHIDKGYKEGAVRFFKEKVNPIGVRTNIVKKIGNKFYQNHKQEWGYGQFKELSEELFKTGVFEHGIIATILMRRFTKVMKEDDFYDFERWIDKYIHNWAHCDIFCSGVVGMVILNYSRLSKETLKWTKSDNRWKRRAAAVSYIKLAKEKDLLPIIFKTAELLIKDDDDLVQKGYGWALKDASYYFKKEVIIFLLKHKDMPRTALRYACERLSKEEKSKILMKGIKYK